MPLLKNLTSDGTTAEFLRLNQTTPQTVSNGTPIFIKGIKLNGTLGTPAEGLIFGDGNTGIYENLNDQLYFNINGSAKYGMYTTQFAMVGGSLGYWGLLYEIGSTTNPNIVPNRNDVNTGIGSGTDAQFSLIASSAEIERITANGVIFYRSMAYPYRAINAIRTLDATDYQIECTANTFDVTLPTAVGIQGRVYSIKNTGAGVITVRCNGAQTIDGSGTQTLNQWDNITIMSNNANWIII